MKRPIIAALALALSLTACASKPGGVTGAFDSGLPYQVTLGTRWSDVTSIMRDRAPRVRLLSIDGPLLNRLYLAGGLRGGDYMLRPERRETPTPLYRADMSDLEIVEFVSDNVAALGYQRPQTAALRPQTFGALPGVRFDLTTQTPEGLDMQGTALVARQGDLLNVMLYLAPSEHYYATNLPEAERIFASAVFED